MQLTRERLSILVQEFFLQLQDHVSKFWSKYICFELRHGANLPPFYGIAGYNKITERIFVLPIGINYLYGMAKWFYHEIAEGVTSRAESYTYKTGRQLGQLAGEQRGYHLGYVDAKNGEPNRVMAALRASGMSLPDENGESEPVQDDGEVYEDATD